MDSQVASLLASLAEIGVKNSAQAIFSRIKASKAAKNTQETISLLEDLINELINERSELQRIANALSEHVVAETISEDDIKFITDKLVPVLEFFAASNNSTDNQSFVQFVTQINKLLSPEVLTILQLIGFNYRRAIGDPLTDFISSKIRSGITSDMQEKAQLLAIQHEVELLKIIQNPDAWERWNQLRNN